MRISSLLCTYNPVPELLQAALSSLEKQTFRDFEVLLVDNNSSPPLDERALRRAHRLDLRVIREPRQGLTQARCTAIVHASGGLLVFVDDDNELDDNYLEEAVRIAREHPEIGHFGGIARPALTHPIPAWKEKLLPYLGVRNYGDDPITSFEPRWGKWEPIGAGMVTRPPIAREFVRLVQDHGSAARLGRRGTALMSGEDSLMARAANRLGYACSYQPALQLTHYIKASRLRPSVLARTIEGHGRSFVVLERLLQRRVQPPGALQIPRELVWRYIHRVRQDGLAAGTIAWFWDVGYFRQARQPE